MFSKKKALLIFLILAGAPLFSLSFSGGYRVFISLGQGSGKGFWDQTEPHEDGRLYALPGGGASLFGEATFSRGIIFDMALQYSFASAGQEVGSAKYRYRQQSFELPLMIKKSKGRNDRLSFGLGPTLIFLPFQALREKDENGLEISDNVKADQKILLGLQIGGDFRIPLSEKEEIVLSLHFVHPFISPAYMWDASGSGNYRINRFDFGIGMRTKALGKKG